VVYNGGIMDGSWAKDVFAAYRSGVLGADELWCVVLECFEHRRPAALAATVLRAYAPAAAAGVAVEEPAAADEFVIDDADHGEPGTPAA
jgi:hypothetical protein